MRVSTICIPIHGDMILNIKDAPEGRKVNVNKIRKILDGQSFEQVKSLLSKSGFSDQLSVSMIQKTS